MAIGVPLVALHTEGVAVETAAPAVGDRQHVKINGGFGRAPKFPQPSKISAMLLSAEKKHYGHAIFTLDKIRCGGITDQIGGGVPAGWLGGPGRAHFAGAPANRPGPNRDC